MKNYLLIPTLILAGTIVATAANIRGTVREAATGDVLPQASIRVLAAKDSTLVTGVATGDNGRFSISVKAGKYIVEASYVGFEAQYQNITLADKDVTLKPFDLAEGAIMLKEATVTGIRTPMKVMEDTVEFAAESYKTQPNAVVEDLLKRLPGVEVSSEGKITANGKEVSKILVDGKEFFSDDPTVASRNLPVDMVDKLQVVDRRSDLARMTGVDDGEDETVINLTVKKNMKNGWFGNAEAGYGYGDANRYKASFNINRFFNENQVTFLGGANNINDPAFTDGAGARFQRFGGDNGITSAQSAGVNFNVGNGEIFRVGGNVLYSHTDRNTITSQYRRYLYRDPSTVQNTDKESRDRGHNIRADLRLQWKPDSFNTLEFRPNISLNYNDSESTESSKTSIADASGSYSTLTHNRIASFSDGNSFEFGGRLIYNHNFRRRRGRSFSVMANYNLSNVHETADTRSVYSSPEEADVNDDQHNTNHRWTNTAQARLTWTEPLGNVAHGNFLTVAYSMRYRWNYADKYAYDLYTPGANTDLEPVTDPEVAAAIAAARASGTDDGIIIIDGEQFVLDDNQSSELRNKYMNQDVRVGFRHVDKQHNVNVGVSLVPQNTNAIDYLHPDTRRVDRSVINYAPFLRYRWKISKTRSMNAFYHGRSSQPSVNQMMPALDNSNPLRVTIGNPDLLPTFTHNLNVRFQDFDTKAQRSIMAMIFAQYQQNAIISTTHFNPETGVQTTGYTNVNGVWSIRGMNMVSLPLRNKAFTINNHLMLSYNRSVGINAVGAADPVTNHSNSYRIGESFGIAWRPDKLEFELRPNYNLQYVDNSAATTTDRTVHTYGGTFYATYNIPIGIVLSTDLNYAATKGYADGYDTNTWMWNASVSYQFLRDRSAAITIKAYDLLGQKSNVQRNVTANYIDDTRYNALTRYVMISFSYKFNTFGKGNEPKDRNAYDGPGGHSGPRPSGPPPGTGPRPF